MAKSGRGGPDGRGSGPFDRRLIGELPWLRGLVGAAVGIGLVSTAAVVVQALALARLLAGAMPGAPHGDRLALFVWLAAAALVRAGSVLATECLGPLGASRAKADLRARLLAGTLAGAGGVDGAGGVAASAGGVAASAGGGDSGGVAAGETAGDTTTLAGRGLDALDVYLSRCLPDLVLAAVAPVALAVVVGALDWVSGLVVLTVLALFPVFGALVGRASRDLAGERWRQVEALGRRVEDVFSGMAVLRAFGRSAEQRERIRQAGEALRRASMDTLRVAFLSALVLDTLGSVSVALVAVPLGLRLLDGSVHLTAALAVLIVAPEVFLPLRRASAEFHESAEGLAAAARVLDRVGPRPAAGTSAPAAGTAAPAVGTAAPAGAASAPAAAGAGLAPDPRLVTVGLEAVTVRAAGRAEPVLDGVTLTVNPGEVVALVGANGAGKSTVLSLLLGFVAPTTGTVIAGGRDLRDVDPTGWRRRIAYLPEHPTLIAGTLADNLRLANTDASDDELLAALAGAGACGLAGTMPDGLATRLGDGGRPTSAGERQRIALARTLLRHASLYLLDEPTSHLDEAAEATAIDGLRRAVAGASVVVVTHRPAVTSLADRVLTLRAGGLVAAGGNLAAVTGAPA